MAFVLASSSCVVSGRLNPAILVPEWIVKQGIFPDGEVELMSAMGSGMTAFNMCGLRWHANLARLDVVAEREGADPGDFVAQVLGRLEHTPIRAVGSNFQYSVTSPAEGARLFALAQFTLLKRLESDSRSPLDGTAVADYSYEDAVMRVSLMFERDTVTIVDFNFNRESASAKDAAVAARRWSSDKAETQNVLKTLVGD
jgi:hypothetical protein